MAGIQSGLRPDRLLNMVSGKTWGWTAALSAALLFAVISAQTSFLHADETVAESAAGAPAGFSFENVVEQARGRAAKPFAPADKTLVEFLRKISRWQWDQISFLENRRLWRYLDSDFQAGFFHPGFIFDQPPSVSVVEDGIEKPVEFSTEYFNYPNNELKEEVGRTKSNFAGFRLLYPLHDAERMDEVVSFLGATHFRGLARHSRYGLEARALILNPAHTGGEEFPYFRHFWLLRPEPGASSVTVYALLDSPSLTGAYKFVVSPGPSTVMEVSARLFKRAGHEFPATVGLAPLGSMYLFSEKEGPGGNWRPEVHNSDTLLFSTAGGGEWFSRPLSNPKRLETNSYALSGPSGFGLMQRDSNFDHYQDLNARFEQRPSLWVEPAGDWGPGRLELIEIPADQDINSNILAFWRPEAVAGDSLDFAYKLYWMPAGVNPHQLGRAADTRRANWGDRGSHFLIDFEGGVLTDIPAESGLTSQVEISGGVPVREKKLIKNPVTGGWRLEFKIQPPEAGVVDNLMSARGERHSLHIEAVLKKGENFPDSLTETWIYDLPY